METNNTIKCRDCKNHKPLEDFNRNGNKKWGRDVRCRSCDAVRSRQRKASTRDELIKLKSGPCTDCGMQYPHTGMDFDHLPQYEKVFSINKWRDHGWATVKEELKKCELVCKSCHAIRTHVRLYGDV